MLLKFLHHSACISLKVTLIFCLSMFINSSLKAQTSPFQSFSLKIEPTVIPADTNGITRFYSVALLAHDTMDVANITFNLRGVVTDSLINSQTFVIPPTDGVYQTGYFSNGLIKDGKAIYILLGNIKSKENLILRADIIDDKNKIHLNLTTTE